MESAINIAKYIIRYARNKGIEITNLKLQKILYYTDGMLLGVFGIPAFNDVIEAWKYGPVVPNVYYYYYANGSMPLIEKGDIVLNLDSNYVRLIDSVIESKMRKTGGQLINATHREWPWMVHCNEVEDKPEITKEEMKNWFEKTPEARAWKLAN